MSESDIQLAAEGTGPRVRTTNVTTYEDGSTPLSVEQQVVVLADRLGNYVDDDRAWREQMLDLARQQLELLTIIAAAVTPG